jgi:hypothetical protein
MSREQLAEMRKFCEETTPSSVGKERGSTFRNAPTWVIRRVYEVRKGLTLTPLPAEAYKNAKHGNLISEAERERCEARARLAMLEV